MDMSDYTPTTAEICGMVTETLSEFVSEEEGLARFDRWLAKHEADLRATIAAEFEEMAREALRRDTSTSLDLAHNQAEAHRFMAVAALITQGTTRQEQDHDH